MDDRVTETQRRLLLAWAASLASEAELCSALNAAIGVLGAVRVQELIRALEQERAR